MATLFGLFALAISAAVAWLFGDYLTWLAWAFGFHWVAVVPWIGPAVVGLAVFFLLSSLSAGLLAMVALSGGGIWAAAPTRWVVGKAAFCALLIPTLLVVIGVSSVAGFGFGWVWNIITHPRLILVGLAGPPGLPPHADLRASMGEPFGRLFVLASMNWLAVHAVSFLKRPVAGVTLPFRRLWQAIKMGVGGSANFDGLLDEWRMPWKPGQVILGTSLYEPDKRLGKPDDRHLLTVATTRSGKGRSCIIPNLLTWPGSCLVIDPKGQNAAVTAPQRRAMGQEIHILDPFGELAKMGLDPETYPVQRFNPLASIDLAAVDVVEQIGNLADALIIHSTHGNPFWDNAAKAVLVGIIAHVLVSPKIADADRNLGTVRDYVSETNGRTFEHLNGSASPGNLAAVAYSEWRRASGGAGGDIMTTLAVHVKWLDSIAMRKALAVSDFDLATLKSRDATLYLIIPPEYLEEHARFLRLFITQALKTAGSGVQSHHPMLFILDEFATLGPLKVVEQAAGLMAGGGVRLWPIIQTLTQLRMYGENWETFVSNAGQIQVFAMNDQTTARYFSERLGHHISWRKVRGQNGYEWIPQGATWFKTSSELSRLSNRDSGRAVVFYEGAYQGLVRRPNYDRIFSRDQYSPDPWEANRPKPWRHIIEDKLKTADAMDVFVELTVAGVLLGVMKIMALVESRWPGAQKPHPMAGPSLAGVKLDATAQADPDLEVEPENKPLMDILRHWPEADSSIIDPPKKRKPRQRKEPAGDDAKQPKKPMLTVVPTNGREGPELRP